jgi:outer membrane immunogenic protein
MPLKAAPQPPPPPPLWNWTGLYVGGFFGMGLSRNKFSEANDTVFDNFAASNLCEGISCSGLGNHGLGSHNGLGPLGGFTLGYKWQAPNSPWVVGLEGQFAFADLQGSNTNAASASIFTNKGSSGCIGLPKDASCQTNINHNGQISSKVKDIATIAALFGITSGPQDRTLWFVKGGGAWAKTNFATADNLNGSHQEFNSAGESVFGFNSAASFSGSSDHNRWGWIVGTGVEWGLWGNWSAKIEYDFLTFGSYDVALNGTANVSFPGGCCSFSTAANKTLHVDQQIHMVQVGLNYKFDWGNWGYGH